jgi:hypothetical protein
MRNLIWPPNCKKNTVFLTKFAEVLYVLREEVFFSNCVDSQKMRRGKLLEEFSLIRYFYLSIIKYNSARVKIY